MRQRKDAPQETSAAASAKGAAAMMTMEEFQQEKARLVELYGSDHRDAGQRRVQELAKLYARSRWTQQALAEIEHMDDTRISQLLIFGRFLNSTNGRIVENVPERQFRTCWRKTDKKVSENARFAAVETMLKEKSTTTIADARKLGKTIVAQFADGKWRNVRDIAEAVGADVHAVKALMDRMVAQGLYKTHTERRPAAHGLAAYRIVKGGGRKIDMTAFQAEIKAILDDIDKMLSHDVHYSSAGMKAAIVQFRHTIERLAR